MRAIIYGSSPFINQVDVDKISDHPNNVAIGINKFGRDFHCKFNFHFDSFIDGLLDDGMDVYPYHFQQNHGIKFRPVYTDHPLTSRTYSVANNINSSFLNYQHGQENYDNIGFKCYTVSSVVNWAVLQPMFDDVYLIGVDHNEHDTQFTHYDGFSSPAELTPASHVLLKRWVFECSQIKPVYQCNPDAKGWAIPYFDIEGLY